jgi:hypothetical protein
MLSRPISTNKLGVVANVCNPSYVGSLGKRIMVAGWPWAKSMIPAIKNS